ncbi:MAG: GTP cyclohydrolase I FolE [Chromatiales bacterium]|nr:GTP cyclohydrolase I FolE [Chromatiales bacterium]
MPVQAREQAINGAHNGARLHNIGHGAIPARGSEQEAVATMTSAYAGIIEALGEDPAREGLRDTPARAAKAMQVLTRGYREDLDALINGAVFTSDTDEMVIVRGIELYSLCEHHMLPFIGKCHVAYLPQGRVLGLSKIARIVDHFARRLQIQEVLTRQIATCVNEVIGARGVGVIVEAQHMCMMMRGVEKQNSVMATSCMLGQFRSNLPTREEFLRLVRA